MSSKRFTLTFPLSPEMESFKYKSILLMRMHDAYGVVASEWRLPILSEKEIKLRDFK